MASVVSVKYISEKDKFTQKCVIPKKIFESINFKIGDYVTVKSSKKKYICRVCTTVVPQPCILVDDTVTSEHFYSREFFNYWENIKIPDDISFIKPSFFSNITVKIVYKDNENIVNCDKVVYEDVVHKILKKYVIERNCVVNCSGLKLADFFHIHSIVVVETFPKILAYGRLNKSSEVEIIDLMCKEQMCRIEEFQNMQLGGISDALNTLKMNLIKIPSRILVLGPSGCGKSSFVKKFCCNTFFVILDGLKVTDFTLNKCNMIKEQFSVYLKIFPNNPCILFIDNLVAIAPESLNQKSLSLSSTVMNMINHMDLRVSIIATAINRKNINSKISSLFTREVNLGIPSLQQRKEIIRTCTKLMNCDIDYYKIAEMIPGFVAHDISLLVKVAIKLNNQRTGFIEKNDLKCLTMEDFQKALVCIAPSVLKTSVWNIKVKPIYWKDIGGMCNIKQRLQMCIEWPLHNSEIFKKADLPCPHGVLLFGPPGCCKTTLARGLATECNANFFAANPAQIYSPYVGESEKNITELFYQARLCAPSIIFLDELDSLVNKRKLDKKSQGVGDKVLSALLNEMDGFGTKLQFQNNMNMHKLLNYDGVCEGENSNESTDVIEHHSNSDVIVVAATNRPDLIDDALLRPGRFDIILYVPPPDEEERESILYTLMEHMPIKNIDVKNIAKNTHLFSGADLKNLCNEAAMDALRHDMSALYITEENFSEALKKIQPSITRQQIEMYEKLSSKYGVIIK